MLIKLSYYWGANARITRLNVSPTTPFSISRAKDGAISVCDSLHNNGGYRDVADSLNDLLTQLTDCKVIMTEFKTHYGTVYLNLEESIPLTINEDTNGLVRLNYPTHNNGGYSLTNPIADVLEKVEASYKEYASLFNNI